MANERFPWKKVIGRHFSFSYLNRKQSVNGNLIIIWDSFNLVSVYGLLQLRRQPNVLNPPRPIKLEFPVLSCYICKLNDIRTERIYRSVLAKVLAGCDRRILQLKISLLLPIFKSKCKSAWQQMLIKNKIPKWPNFWHMATFSRPTCPRKRTDLLALWCPLFTSHRTIDHRLEPRSVWVYRRVCMIYTYVYY